MYGGGPEHTFIVQANVMQLKSIQLGTPTLFTGLVPNLNCSAHCKLIMYVCTQDAKHNKGEGIFVVNNCGHLQVSETKPMLLTMATASSFFIRMK